MNKSWTLFFYFDKLKFTIYQKALSLPAFWFLRLKKNKTSMVKLLKPIHQRINFVKLAQWFIIKSYKKMSNIYIQADRRTPKKNPVIGKLTWAVSSGELNAKSCHILLLVSVNCILIQDVNKYFWFKIFAKYIRIYVMKHIYPVQKYICLEFFALKKSFEQRKNSYHT